MSDVDSSPGESDFPSEQHDSEAADAPSGEPAEDVDVPEAEQIESAAADAQEGDTASVAEATDAVASNEEDSASVVGPTESEHDETVADTDGGGDNTQTEVVDQESAGDDADSSEGKGADAASEEPAGAGNASEEAESEQAADGVDAPADEQGEDAADEESRKQDALPANFGTLEVASTEPTNDSDEPLEAAIRQPMEESIAFEEGQPDGSVAELSDQPEPEENEVLVPGDSSALGDAGVGENAELSATQGAAGETLADQNEQYDGLEGQAEDPISKIAAKEQGEDALYNPASFRMDENSSHQPLSFEPSSSNIVGTEFSIVQTAGSESTAPEVLSSRLGGPHQTDNFDEADQEVDALSQISSKHANDMDMQHVATSRPCSSDGNSHAEDTGEYGYRKRAPKQADFPPEGAEGFSPSPSRQLEEGPSPGGSSVSSPGPGSAFASREREGFSSPQPSSIQAMGNVMGQDHSSFSHYPGGADPNMSAHAYPTPPDQAFKSPTSALSPLAKRTAAEHQNVPLVHHIQQEDARTAFSHKHENAVLSELKAEAQRKLSSPVAERSADSSPSRNSLMVSSASSLNGSFAMDPLLQADPVAQALLKKLHAVESTASQLQADILRSLTSDDPAVLEQVEVANQKVDNLMKIRDQIHIALRHQRQLAQDNAGASLSPQTKTKNRLTPLGRPAPNSTPKGRLRSSSSRNTNISRASSSGSSSFANNAAPQQRHSRLLDQAGLGKNSNMRTASTETNGMDRLADVGGSLRKAGFSGRKSGGQSKVPGFSRRKLPGERIDVGFSVGGGSGSGRDMSGRRRAQELLRAERAKYGSAQDRVIRNQIEHESRWNKNVQQSHAPAAPAQSNRLWGYNGGGMGGGGASRSTRPW